MTTSPKKARSAEKELLRDLKILAKEVKAFKELAPFSIVDKPGRLMWLSLLKGIMIGFGTVLGATILVALLIKILAGISFIPIIGDFVQDIIDQLKTAN